MLSVIRLYGERLVSPGRVPRGLFYCYDTYILTVSGRHLLVGKQRTPAYIAKKQRVCVKKGYAIGRREKYQVVGEERGG